MPGGVLGKERGVSIDETLDQIEALLLTIPDRISVETRADYRNAIIRLNNCPGSEYGWVLGYGDALREAYADALRKRDEAAQNATKLRTAAEMREAVLKLVPEDCREAIEALPVAA